MCRGCDLCTQITDLIKGGGSAGQRKCDLRKRLPTIIKLVGKLSHSFTGLLNSSFFFRISVFHPQSIGVLSSSKPLWDTQQVQRIHLVDPVQRTRWHRPTARRPQTRYWSRSPASLRTLGACVDGHRWWSWSARWWRTQGKERCWLAWARICWPWRKKLRSRLENVGRLRHLEDFFC